MASTLPCKICNAETYYFGKATVLGKYEARYQRCGSCGFVFVLDPFWLDEAYRQAIASPDIGTVSRCVDNSTYTKAVLHLLFDPNGSFLDYGAGYGMFVRYMRNKGYQFYWHDAHCENLFAQRFEGDVSGKQKYDLITAFEVFEHLPNPLEEIRRIISVSRNLLFSTELIPSPAPKPQEWWYYALLTGQHLSFFTLASLRIIAQVNDLHLYSISSNLHLLCDRQVSPALVKIISKPWFTRWFDFLKQRPTLLNDDWINIRKQISMELGTEYVP